MVQTGAEKGRMTRQRRAVYEALMGTHEHPTADQLYHQLCESMPRISLATVYRNLERLAEEGKIRVIELPGLPRRYDADLSSHYHVRCVHCGRIGDIELDRVPSLASVAHRTGTYKLLEMRLEFDGVCEECAKKS